MVRKVQQELGDLSEREAEEGREQGNVAKQGDEPESTGIGSKGLTTVLHSIGYEHGVAHAAPLTSPMESATGDFRTTESRTMRARCVDHSVRRAAEQR